MKRLLVVIAALVLVGTSACIRSESSQGVQAGGKPVTEKTLPPCPLGALEKAKGTVNVELWEAFVGQAKEYINQLADDFNKSQSKVHVEVRSQGDSYDELLQKFQAGLASKQLPAIALVEDQNLRVMVDTGAVLPAESCQRADKSDFPVLPAVRNYYTIDDVFWPGYVDVSEPVLYYNVNHFKKAGLDSTKPPLTLDDAREDGPNPEGEGRLQQAAARPQDGLVVHRVLGQRRRGDRRQQEQRPRRASPTRRPSTTRSPTRSTSGSTRCSTRAWPRRSPTRRATSTSTWRWPSRTRR